MDHSGRPILSDGGPITVPASGHAAVLTELAEVIDDRIVVDTVVPMVVDKDGPRPAMPDAGSAAEEAWDLLPKAKEAVENFQKRAPV